MYKTRVALAALIPALIVLPFGGAAQEATPTTTYSCEPAPASPMAGTPPATMGGMAGMAMGTPAVGMTHGAMELDQAYIDMMIPHHASIIAMAEAALPRLTDERLREIAQAVITTQQPEIDELRDLRQRLYGDPNPMPMDAAMMAAMDEMMPGMGTMDEMTFQMDTAAQVAAICAAEDMDLAFIDLTIPHHQMAIVASEAVVAKGSHPEIREIAEQVIAAQQQEIDELAAIRAELTSEGTPAGT